MFRKMIFSMVVMVVAIGFVCADEFTAQITKVDGDKVTLVPYKKKPITLNAKGAKVNFGTFDNKTRKFEAGDAVEGGLTNKMFANEKGQSALIITDADKNITQVGILKKKAK